MLLNMKHCLPLLALLCALSCYRQPLLPDEYGRRVDWDPHTGHVYQRETKEQPPGEGGKTFLLSSGVEYPPGYDWVRDTAHSSVSAHIVLFDGDVERLRVRAGNGAAWSIDPDCHRIRDGHLYTFARGGGKTIIGRDGERILSYDGEESIRGFAVEGGKILTLGQGVGSSGLSFRMDGKPVFHADDGYVRGSLDNGLPGSGALYADNGHWYFSYTSRGRLHLVEDGRELSLPDRDGWADAVMLNGELYLVRIRQGTPNWYVSVYCGRRELDLPIDLREAPASCRLVAGENCVRLVMEYRDATYVWDAPVPVLRGYYRGEVELFPDKGGDAMVLSMGGKVREIVPGTLPEGTYTLLSGACVRRDRSGAPVLGLSGLDGSPNTIIRDTTSTILQFNGPITSLEVG